MEIKYLRQRAFVRSLPKAKCVALDSLKYGDKVITTGNTKDAYVEIEYQGGVAWVSVGALSDTPMRVHSILGIDGHPAENMVDFANFYLSRLPVEFINKVESHGWHILITNKDLDEYFYKGKYGGVAGVADYSTHNVYLQDTWQDISEAIYHELGHVVDYLSGMVSDTPEFLAIYDKEKDNFNDSTAIGDGHEKSCPREYFASVFSEMVYHKAECECEIPESCSFLENFVNNFVKKT